MDKYNRKHIQSYWRTSINERTHFFIKDIPLALYSRKGCERVDAGYVWEVIWRRGQTATYWPKVALTIAALLSHLGWAAQPGVTESPSPQSASWFSRWHLVPNWLQMQLELNSNWLTHWLKPSVAPGYIIVWPPRASCGRTHLHRIQPRPQVKVIFRYTLLKPDCHSWWISKMQSRRENIFEERYAIKFCFKLGKNAKKHMECFRLLLGYLAWIGHQFLMGIRNSRKAESLWEMMRGVGGVRKSIHHSQLVKGLGLVLLCWGF